jgi:hypothetical protein
VPTTDADKLFTVFYITIGLSVIYAVSYMVVVLSVSNAACSLLALMLLLLLFMLQVAIISRGLFLLERAAELLPLRALV